MRRLRAVNFIVDRGYESRIGQRSSRLIDMSKDHRAFRNFNHERLRCKTDRIPSSLSAESRDARYR